MNSRARLPPSSSFVLILTMNCGGILFLLLLMVLSVFVLVVRDEEAGAQAPTRAPSSGFGERSAARECADVGGATRARSVGGRVRGEAAHPIAHRRAG